MKRVRVARLSAALGAACLLVAPLARTATAAAPPLEIYDAGGFGQGVVATFAVRPSIFDPLVNAGLLYGEATLSSQGGGSAYALSSQVFPGKFAVGAIGCGGLPGGQWVQGKYPPTGGCAQTQETKLFDSSTTKAPGLDGVIEELNRRAHLGAGSVRASTDLGRSEAVVRVADYRIGTDADAPLVVIGDLRVVTTARWDNETVEHRTRVIARDVSLLAGGIRIDQIVSTATTASNGVTATADSSMTLGDMTVTTPDGTTHRATIDSTGVRVLDVSHEQSLAVEEDIREGLLRAGITITTATPDEIVDGPSAEASIGGLVLSFSVTLPSAPVPDQVAEVIGPVLEEIQTRCLSDFGLPIPLCFGAGLAPGGESENALQLAIASASSFSVGAPGFVFDPGTGGTTGGFGATGGFDPGATSGGFGPVSTGGFDAGTTTGGGQETTTGVGAPAPRGPLVGLVARMPDELLAWGGAALLILAVGLAIGPSLRHAGAR